MNAYFKRLNLIMITLILILIPAILFQFINYNTTIRQEIEKNIALQLNITSQQLSNDFMKSVHTIESIERFILSSSDEVALLEYLTLQLENDPSYFSLYFGTPDNRMINGSGWIPPSDFDLRTRPWYTKATENKQLITTSIYRNASNDHYIVTYAKPIYNTQGDLLGVIGGDNAIDQMLTQLKTLKSSTNDIVFFLDYTGELIMHSGYDDGEVSNHTTEEVLGAILPYLSDNDHGIKFTKLNEVAGYLSWNTIDATGWIVGNFSPYNEFEGIQQNYRNVLILLFLSLLIILFLIIFLQRKKIEAPLRKLNHDIHKIDLSEDITYRLEANKIDPFVDIRTTINLLLTNIQNYFEQLEEINVELEVSQEKNKAIIDVLPDMIFVYNRSGVFIDYLTSPTDELILSKNDFIGKTLHQVMPKDIADEAMDKMDLVFQTGLLQQFEYSLDMPNGIEHFECRLQKINDNEAISIVRNITDSLKNLERIQVLSYHDQLTGLYNRRFFEEEMARLDAGRNTPLSLIIFDVNGLKLTNDAFGHLTGDNLLVKVSEIMTAECRGDEVIARIGGDEFVILLPNTSSDDTSIIVERIQTKMANTSIKDIPLSVSGGWATKIKKDQDITDIFIEAENMMYQKKIIESQSMRNQAIQSILFTLNHKNPLEKFHSERVSSFSRQIGEKLGLRYEELKELETAGLVHDVGKIALSDDILSKSGPLTTIEYEEVKRHAEIGYQMLKLVDTYSSIAEYVLHHHERWDGGGYPQGLAGSEIPLFSRIICIADAFEAMTSDRPFRKKLSLEQAIKELEDNANKQFDPHIVGVFLDTL